MIFRRANISYKILRFCHHIHLSNTLSSHSLTKFYYLERAHSPSSLQIPLSGQPGSVRSCLGRRNRGWLSAHPGGHAHLLPTSWALPAGRTRYVTILQQSLHRTSGQVRKEPGPGRLASSCSQSDPVTFHGHYLLGKLRRR